MITQLQLTFKTLEKNGVLVYSSGKVRILNVPNNTKYYRAADGGQPEVIGMRK
jgi:hypothetical protein